MQVHTCGSKVKDPSMKTQWPLHGLLGVEQASAMLIGHQQVGFIVRLLCLWVGLSI